MTLQQILKSVSSHLPPSFDRENIAAELWVGAFERQEKNESATLATIPNRLDPPLSNQIIHNRCVDEIRRRKIEKESAKERHCYPSNIPEDERELVKRVEFLICQSDLSRQAQLVIMEKFFLGSSLKLIAEHLMISTKEVSTILEKTLERLRAVARETRNETLKT